MKNKFFAAAACVLTACMLAACGTPSGGAAEENSDKISIVCTIFPLYDWVRSVVGEDNAEVDIKLLATGGDLHSFQPSAKDIAEIATSDMFLYVGGSSDKWADDTVKNSGVKGCAVRLFDILADELEEEEIKDGMQAESHIEEDLHGDEKEYDEHLWLSLRRAMTAVGAIADDICTLDGGNAEKYKSNAEKYMSELDSLDREYAAAVESSPDKTVIFADRFPFRYLTDDYGIEYYAAFPGCSADTEASFETVIYLANTANRLKKDTLLVLENSKQSIADTVIANTKRSDIKTAVMNSCQSVTKEDIQNGMSYISVMRQNLEPLKAALGCTE